VRNPAGAIIASRWVADWSNADHRPPEELLALMGPPGSGWRLCWSGEIKAGKPWSREARARERRRRLRARLEKKYPLFVNEFFATDVANRPDYFSGRHPVFDAGRPGGPPAHKEVSCQSNDQE
jgi:hypothetical protein